MKYLGWGHILMLKPAGFSRSKAIHSPFEALNRVKLTCKLMF